MSESNTPPETTPTLDPNEWVWQGFEAPLALATTLKAITDKDERAGLWAPLRDEPPMIWNKAGTRAMWAMLTRRSAPIPVPDGCEEAESLLAGRMVGAG